MNPTPCHVFNLHFPTLTGLTLAVLLASAARSEAGSKKSSDEEIRVVKRSPIEFPAQPARLSNQPLVGMPEIRLPAGFDNLLGGEGFSEIGRQKLVDLLVKTERFRVVTKGVSHCGFTATVTRMEVIPSKENQKLNVPKTVWEKLPFPKKKHGLDMPFPDPEIDWNTEDLEITVKCGVSLNFLDAASYQILESGSAEVQRTDTLKNIRLEFEGISYQKTAERSNDTKAEQERIKSEIKANLFEVAAYEALKSMLPGIDSYLAENQARFGTAPAQPAQPTTGEESSHANQLAEVTERPGTDGPNFCSECGKRLHTTASFCSNCGKRIVKRE